MRAKTEPWRRLVASRGLVWERLFLVRPMEVNAWMAGSNGPAEMCGVISEINGGYTSGKSGWGILGKKVRATPHWSLGTALATVELCLRYGIKLCR